MAGIDAQQRLAGEVADQGGGVLPVQSPQHLEGGQRDMAVSLEDGQLHIPVAGICGESVDAGAQRDRQAVVRIVDELAAECFQIGVTQQIDQLLPVMVA